MGLRASCLSLLIVLCGTADSATAQELVAADLQSGLLRLKVDRGLENVRHFVLKDPPRLVLDLYGIRGTSAVLPPATRQGSVAGMRVGRHPGKLRVVVDFERTLRPYRLRHSKRVVEVELTSERSSEGTTPARPSEKLEREAPGIRLLGEGSLESVKHFVTEKPPRLMLDLHGIRDVSASLKGAPVPLPIKGLRKIQKPDRIRVIVDFERPLVAFRVRRAGSVVEIDMQPGSALPTPADPRRAEPNATPVADVRPAPSAPEPGDPDSRSAPNETDPVQVTDPVRQAIRGMLTRGAAYSMRESVPSATPVAPQEDPVGQRVVRVRN